MAKSCYAIAHLGFGNRELALTLLEEACSQRELQLAALGVHPIWDPLRGHPAFEAILKKVGLSKHRCTPKAARAYISARWHPRYGHECAEVLDFDGSWFYYPQFFVSLTKAYMKDAPELPEAATGVNG